MSGSYQLPPAQEVQNLLRVVFLDTNSSVEMHIFTKKKMLKNLLYYLVT